MVENGQEMDRKWTKKKEIQKRIEKVTKERRRKLETIWIRIGKDVDDLVRKWKQKWSKRNKEWRQKMQQNDTIMFWWLLFFKSKLGQKKLKQSKDKTNYFFLFDAFKL